MTLFQVRFFKFSIIVVAALSLLLLVTLAVMSFVSPSPTPAAETIGGELFVRPNMSLAIPVLFDVENERISYDYALVGGDNGSDALVETSSFERFGQSYEFLLTTKKAKASDADYTIADYLALTLTDTDENGVTNEIVYIDLGADAELDSVYLNDVNMSDPRALVEAQNQYITELVLSRDYMLGVSN